MILLLPLQANAREAVNFIRAHNFRISGTTSLRSWLGVPELSRNESFEFATLFSENRDVPSVYSDIQSKDQARIQNRLNASYGKPLDAEAKVGLKCNLGEFEQAFSINAAADMMVSDPVFPQLEGMIFNDYTLVSSYKFIMPYGIKFHPSLQYGLRRTMQKSFTVGQLLDKKPNKKLEEYSYKFYAETSLVIEKSFDPGILSYSVSSFPIKQNYDYWKTEISARSHDLLKSTGFLFPKQAYLWASFSPLFGGLYSWKRTIQAGTSLGLTSFLRADFFFFDNFRIATILTAKIDFFSLDLFSFERSLDDYKNFNSRQYGISIAAKF